MEDSNLCVVELSRWRIAAYAEDDDEAEYKRAKLQESADQTWNYENPHRTPRYYDVMTVEQYYRYDW